MGSIRIISPGFLTTIQDYGRTGYQQFGIPQGGVMDRYSMELSNILAGNPRGEGVFEITMAGPVIEFHGATVFALAGSDMRPRLNGNEIQMYKTIKASRGDILEFSTTLSGCRTYLAVSGGFNIEKVMGSKSTYIKGGFGGFHGRALQRDDILYINEVDLNNIEVRSIPDSIVPIFKRDIILRVVMGPEEDYFTPDGANTFLSNKYTLTSQCDRMGYRLEGLEIKHKQGADILSDGINFGAVQIPGNGKPIIMMSDRQTTGGYTKIANVISVDMPFLAQLKPGDSVNFMKVSVDEAQRLAREQENKILGLIDSFNRPYKATSMNYIVRINGNEYRVNVEEVR